MKPCKEWDKLPISWWRISAINSITGPYEWLVHRFNLLSTMKAGQEEATSAEKPTTLAEV